VLDAFEYFKFFGEYLQSEINKKLEKKLKNKIIIKIDLLR
jgi:hypothetical protein